MLRCTGLEQVRAAWIRRPFEDVADPAVPLARLIGDSQYAGKEPCALFEKVLVTSTAQAGVAVCHPQGGIPVG
jgi:hypothetical protein